MKNEQSYRSYGNGTGVGGRSVTKNFDGPRKPLSVFSRSGKSLTCVRFIVASEIFYCYFFHSFFAPCVLFCTDGG